MKIIVNIGHAARNNVVSAHIREVTRLCLIADALDKHGCQVGLTQITNEFRESDRWQFFQQLDRPIREPDWQIVSAETLIKASSFSEARTIAFKSSVRCDADSAYLNHCDLLVAHEYNRTVETSDKLLPVPFMISDKIMSQFIADGMFENYRTNNLAAIRSRYNHEQTVKRVGFAGAALYGRKQMLGDYPDWLECHWRVEAEDPLTVHGYLQFISRCAAGLNMPGDTPKSYRQSELALFGIPGCAPPCPIRSTPAVDATNSIVMRDWDDWDHVWETINVPEAMAALRRRVDRVYLEGWSPFGQANQILKWIESH